MASLATAVTAAAMFLSITVLGRRGWAPTHTLRGVYGLALIGFLAWAVMQHHHEPAALLPSWGAISLLLLCGVMTWLGNVGVAMGLPRAANPGYGLAALGTCSAVIAIGALLIYGDAISAMGMVGIALCIVGLPLLAWRGTAKTANGTDKPATAPAAAKRSGAWLPLVLLGVVMFSASLLAMRGLGRGPAPVGAPVQLVWLYVGMLACLFFVRAPPLPPGAWWRDGWIVLVGGASCFIANECQVFATLAAPNPGYAIAIAALQTPLAALLAVPLLGDRFGGYQALGLLCCLIGATAIALPPNVF
jgi:drug/metabolite transporter (DMT)-like permease